MLRELAGIVIFHTVVPRDGFAHNFPENFVPQDYLGEQRRYYEPTEQGVEKKIKERLDRWRALSAQATHCPPDKPGAQDTATP